MKLTVTITRAELNQLVANDIRARSDQIRVVIESPQTTRNREKAEKEEAAKKNIPTEIQRYRNIITQFPEYTGSQKISAIKAMREAIPGMGLIQAKALMEYGYNNVEGFAENNNGKVPRLTN